MGKVFPDNQILICDYEAGDEIHEAKQKSWIIEGFEQISLI